MPRFVDLSHVFEDRMPGFRMAGPDGVERELTARIRPFLTHAESAPLYRGRAAFEITEVSFQTSIGTYIDAPFHRFPEGRDFSECAVGEFVAPGRLVDVRGLEPGEAVPPDALPDAAALRGRAVLFRFDWDRHWGGEAYRRYPFLSPGAIDRLVAAAPAMVGVDTLNIDDAADPGRPAHTRLLDRDIFIVENLRNLGSLSGRRFRFFAVPVRARRVAAWPVRAFAEIEDD